MSVAALGDRVRLRSGGEAPALRPGVLTTPPAEPVACAPLLIRRRAAGRPTGGKSRPRQPHSQQSARSQDRRLWRVRQRAPPPVTGVTARATPGPLCREGSAEVPATRALL